MYRQVITPDKNHHSIELPKELYGKTLEVIFVEVDQPLPVSERGTPPPGKAVTMEDLFESFEADPDFPTTGEIRSKAWPSKKW